jgi:uncharacterized paraquat-inducible protein A
MPTTTEYGYCPHCHARVELVQLGTTESALCCARCDAADIYDSEQEYDRLQNNKPPQA